VVLCHCPEQSLNEMEIKAEIVHEHHAVGEHYVTEISNTP